MKLTYYCIYNVVMVVIGSSLAYLHKIILLMGFSEVKCLGFLMQNLKFQLRCKINFRFKS